MTKYTKFSVRPVVTLCTVILFGMLFFAQSSLPARAEDGWLTGTLRTDENIVKTAQDYVHYITALALPNHPYSSTDAYLKIYAPPSGGLPSAFSLEVGISTGQPAFTLPGRYWYVQSGQSVQCLRGSQSNPSRCGGLRGDTLTSTDSEYRVELVTYGSGFWIARFKNLNTSEIADVTKIYIPQTTIHSLFASTFIEERTGPVNTAIIRHRYTQYMLWGTGFQPWLTSFNGNNNTLIANSLGTTCPNTYSGKTNYNGDIRAWLAGYSNGVPGTCNANPLF